jgi:hypothetical protein
VQCPRCGFDQPASEECIACGVVISKYLSTVDELAGIGAEADPLRRRPVRSPRGPRRARRSGDRRRPLPARPDHRQRPLRRRAAGLRRRRSMDPFPSRPMHDAEGGPIRRPRPRPPRQPRRRRRPATASRPFDFGQPPAALHRRRRRRCIRIVAAFTCAWAWPSSWCINGEGLRSAWPYAVMVLYGAGALWGLLTARQSITVRQFGIEMAVLAAGHGRAAPRLARDLRHRVAARRVGQARRHHARCPTRPSAASPRSSLDFLEATGDVLQAGARPSERERWATLSKTLDFSARSSSPTTASTPRSAPASSTSGSASPTSAPSSPACSSGTWSKTPTATVRARDPRGRAPRRRRRAARDHRRACAACRSASAKSSTAAPT